MRERHRLEKTSFREVFAQAAPVPAAGNRRDSNPV